MKEKAGADLPKFLNLSIIVNTVFDLKLMLYLMDKIASLNGKISQQAKNKFEFLA